MTSPPRPVSHTSTPSAARRSGVASTFDRAASLPAAERDDVGMLEQQQHVPDLAGPPLLDERALQLERLAVGHAPQPADLEVLHLYSSAGSNVSSCFLTTDMNWSATAPSMIRWS